MMIKQNRFSCEKEKTFNLKKVRIKRLEDKSIFKLNQFKICA